MNELKEKKKFYLPMEKRNEDEKRTGKASYATIIDRYVGSMLLCNNIADVDPSVWDNINTNLSYYIDDNGDYRTQEEYDADETGTIYEEYEDIYQYYLCHLNGYEIEKLTECGIVLSYSDMLECDVLCVTHFGTAWDYVPTDVELTENYEEGL